MRSKIDNFEEGTITVSQDFMNSATMKYNKIVTKEGSFKASVHTVQEDIIVLITEKAK